MAFGGPVRPARFIFAILCTAALAVSVAAIPVYPCPVKAEDSAGGGEGVGCHDTTPGNSGGVYRNDDVEIGADATGYFVNGTAPDEWLCYDFWVNSTNTEGDPIPVLLRMMSAPEETWIAVGVDGVTSQTFPVWCRPGAWNTVNIQIAYPRVGSHRLRVAFPEDDIRLDSIELAGNRASGWGDIWGGAPGLAASATPMAGCAPLTVRFADRSRPYPMYSWQWDFGDGNRSTEQNPVPVYSTPGTYTMVFLEQADSYWNYPMWVAIWDMRSSPLYLSRTITVNPPPGLLPGSDRTPSDPDGDGLYEDLNGNGRPDFADVVLYFDRMEWSAANGPAVAFDFNGNGRIDFADMVALFDLLGPPIPPAPR